MIKLKTQIERLETFIASDPTTMDKEGFDHFMQTTNGVVIHNIRGCIQGI